MGIEPMMRVLQTPALPLGHSGYPSLVERVFENLDFWYRLLPSKSASFFCYCIIRTEVLLLHSRRRARDLETTHSLSISHSVRQLVYQFSQPFHPLVIWNLV